ncbi:Sushi domain (SCR repeat) family protein [Acanthocheilonema viteae]
MLDYNYWIYFILSISIIKPVHSGTITCPPGGYPNNLIPVLIWTKYFNQTSKIYRIGSSELKQEYFTNSSSDEIFLNSGIPTACPERCTLKLSTNIRSTDGVVLHQDNKGHPPPSGYVDISGPKELFCAQSFGNCGANAPIYRYKNRNQLINNSYAYSFRANELINGYVRELHPICYGWKDSSSKSGSSRSNNNEITGTKDPTDCTPIQNVRNGQVIYKLSEASENSETIMMGSFAILNCNEGYKPSTQNQIACITGTWYPTDEIGECIPISNEIPKSCAPLPPHENGYIRYNQHGNINFPSGTLAYLICTDHYHPIFNRQAQCYNGQWSTLKLGICQPTGNTSCAPLPAVQNGKVKYLTDSESNITIGTVAELECFNGYVVNGFDVLICEPHGWAPAPILGTCRKDIRRSDQRGKRQDMRPCPTGHPIVSNGQLTYSNEPNLVGAYPSETVAIVRCNTGYTIYGALLSICEDSIWKPRNLGICILPSAITSVPSRNSCLFGLLSPVGGTVTYSKGSSLGPFPSGTLAVLKCLHGISHGPTLAACDNGSWIPPEMGSCSLPHFENSSNIPLTNNLNNAILNTTLVSPSQIVTLVGSCVTGITPPANGYISYSTGSSNRPFPSGTVATINCDRGFKPVGITSSTCLNGIWSPLVVGQCIVDTGPRLFGVPLSSRISVSEVGQCPTLPAPLNGRISYSSGSEIGPFPTGTTATVICNPNYVLLGLSAAICTNGVFTPLLLAHCVPGPGNVESLLKMKELPCVAIPKPPNGDVIYSDITATVYASRTTANLACDFGFIPIGPVETTCKNGQWQPILGFCQQSIITSGISQIPILRQCLFELPAVVNGQIRYSTGNMLPPYESGTIATLICNSGNVPIGRKSSTCINGSWNPLILGQCPINDNGKDYLRTGLKQTALPSFGCPTSPPVSNGRVYYSNVSKNNVYATDTVANLVCDDGYQILGRSISYCQGGIWSPWPGVGSCQPAAPEQRQQQQQHSPLNRIKPANACSEVPITPANGMIIYEGNNSTKWHNNGASAKLQCNAGYKINGEQMTYCQDGFWSPSLGSCQHAVGTKTGDSCEPFNAPSNGKVYYIYNNYIRDYQMGTTALLSCNKGYRVQGEATLICNQNGWTPNGGFGICIPVDDNFRKHS